MPGRAATTRIAWVAEDRATVRHLRAPILASLIGLQHKVLVLAPDLTEADRLALMAQGIGCEAFEYPKSGPWPLAGISARRQLSRTLLAWNARIVVADGATVLELAARATRQAGIGQFYAIAPPLQGRNEARAMQRKVLGMMPAFVSSTEEARQIAAWLPDTAAWSPQVLPLAALQADHSSAVALPGLESGLAFAAVTTCAQSGLFGAAVQQLDTRAARARFKQLSSGNARDIALTANRVETTQVDPSNLDQHTAVLAAAHIVVVDGQSALHHWALATALSLGRPVLAIETSTSRDLIDSGVNGWLVPANPDALAAGMSATLKRPDLLPGMAHAARQKAERRFGHVVVRTAVTRALGLTAPASKAA